uniref:Uncharacterized protein n=1 Tax=Cajanus cajan TaxID=3821 RepID=A0A151SSB5_CAJCA|nr:hypothetical protein KK1_003942 [Cajanus cajan]
MSSAKGESLLKAVLKKVSFEKGNNVIESKQISDSKKKPNCNNNQQNYDGKKLLKVVTKGTEKLNIKESKKKSSKKSKTCCCAPTTHEGSFKCHYHRNKSSTNKSYVGTNDP